MVRPRPPRGAPARVQVPAPVRPRRAGVLGEVRRRSPCPRRVAPRAARAGRPTRRVPHLPGQPALRRPGRLHPAPDPRAGRASATASRCSPGRRGPSSTRASGSPPCRGLDLYRDPDPFRIPARSRVHARSPTWSSSRRCCLAGFGEPLAYSHADRRSSSHRDATSSTSSTTTSASATGILELHRRGLAAPRDPAPPDHRRPLDRPRPRRVGAWQRFTTQAVVRVPSHAGARRPRAARGAHGLGELAASTSTARCTCRSSG